MIRSQLLRRNRLRPLLRPLQAAKTLGVSVRTLRTLTARAIPHVVIGRLSGMPSTIFDGGLKRTRESAAGRRILMVTDVPPASGCGFPVVVADG